mmetsp:Transcript_8752/g.13071  ORF Transcript_8752/g.13071 Transcript_8752/m.13071 type:complete len:154 (+) Transcript_8752:100-561(+)
MPKCKMCDKSVFPMDPQINLDGDIIHNTCAKCEDCKGQITLSNFVKNSSPQSTLLLCKTHYMKRFHEQGQYLGGEKYGKKTEVELRGAGSGSVTPINSSMDSPTPASHDAVVSPSLTVKEITRRMSIVKPTDSATKAANTATATSESVDGEKK